MYPLDNVNSNNNKEGKTLKTPKQYNDNLKNKIITEEMFSDCLYSVNKRAKNYRDKAHEYKYRYRFYHKAVDSQFDKMNEFYNLKERLLKYLNPKCIHRQFIGYETERVYSYEKEYFNRKGKRIVWENCYYDDDMGLVEFYDYETEIKRYLYFLYYELTQSSFHTPIKSPNKYELDVVDIDEDFTTYGANQKDLVSAQFVKKVINTLETTDCTLILNDETIEIKNGK